MADFLSALLGNGGDDPRTQAIGLLGANMMAGNAANGFAAANGAFANAGEAALKKRMVEMQLANYASEIETRKLKVKQDERQQAMLQGLLGGGGGTPAMAPAGPAIPGLEGYLQGAQPSGGPAYGGMGPNLPQAPQAAPQGQVPAGGILGLAKQLGMPPEAIQADIVFNGGKKVGEMLAKRSEPNWQNINGNLVNTADPNFKGGFQPGMNTSANGQVTAWQPDGNGGLVVGAPRGALDTYRAYQNVGEDVKAGYDPQTVTPAGQAPQLTTRRAIVNNPAVGGGAGPAGFPGARISPQQQAAMDADRMPIFQAELAKAQGQLATALRSGDQSAAARAQSDIASIQREMGGRAASVGMPLASPEDALRATKGVEGDAKANESRATDIKTAQKYLSVASQAADVLKQGPTGSGIGSAVDKLASLGGYATKGSIAAQQLSALGGWLTANVPRMEGPQSNFDVGNYQRMAADVGNDMLPIARRQAALQTITQMMQGIVEGKTGGGAEGSWEPSGKKSAMSSGGWSATLRK